MKEQLADDSLAMEMANEMKRVKIMRKKLRTEMPYNFTDQALVRMNSNSINRSGTWI